MLLEQTQKSLGQNTIKTSAKHNGLLLSLQNEAGTKMKLVC